MAGYKQIGFIGTGVMGERMCRNLAKKTGVPVIAFDKDMEKVAALSDVSVEAAMALSRFKDFITGTLPGIPLQVGREVLEETVEKTYESLGLNVVKRNWLLAVAEKP